MRRFLSSIALLALCWPVACNAHSKKAVAADEKAEPAKYARGRVVRPDAAAVRQKKTREHGLELRRLYMRLNLPASFDARLEEWVPDVQDQGQCGSCWDFSGTGMVDIAYPVSRVGADPNKFLFSEQYTLDCGRNGGCNGDDCTTVLDWAEKTGLPLSADYGPYKARRGSCKNDPAMKMYKIETWGYADPNGRGGVTSADYIKGAIQLYGCVGCAVAAGAGWDSYRGGVYKGSGNQSIDHDVILIGWDDAKGVSPGKTCWLMRNSWGTSWGEQGYMWIAEGADMIGTDACWCRVAPVPVPPVPPTPPVPPVPPTPPAPPAPKIPWLQILLTIAGIIIPIFGGGYILYRRARAARR